MSSDDGIDVEDLDFPTSYNYSHVNEIVVHTTNRNINNEQATNYGAACPFILNEGSLNNLDVRHQSNDDSSNDEARSVFNGQLILVKNLKSPFDIRYKTDYFPHGGKNARRSQAPRYLLTVDDDQEIVIKFPAGYTIPQNPGPYLLEVGLLTAPHFNQHHMHVNKFQLHHTDVNVLDQNPLFIYLTPENFENGEVRFKLVVIKTLQSDLKNLQFLPLFGGRTLSDWTTDCKSLKELEATYELNHARVAFSLGYINTNNEFIRFTNTTVMSNVIIEKEKPKPADSITCPNCSHCFSIKEQKQKGRKRTASSSDSTKKKRSS